MAIEQIQVLPTQNGFGIDYSKNALSVKLEGGRSRFGLNKKNGVSIVNVQYDLNADDYQYFWAFFNNSTERGALPFRSELYLNSNELTLHLCKFVQGSIKLLSQRGGRFIVGATLEVSENA